MPSTSISSDRDRQQQQQFTITPALLIQPSELFIAAVDCAMIMMMSRKR